MKTFLPIVIQDHRIRKIPKSSTHGFLDNRHAFSQLMAKRDGLGRENGYIKGFEETSNCACLSVSVFYLPIGQDSATQYITQLQQRVENLDRKLGKRAGYMVHQFLPQMLSKGRFFSSQLLALSHTTEAWGSPLWNYPSGASYGVGFVPVCSCFFYSAYKYLYYLERA